MKRYDITLVERKSEFLFQVYYIYPNEDNGELTPVVWTAHHFWDGQGTIEDFSMKEDRAYLYEDYKSLEECFDMFNGKFIWFNSEKEIEDYLPKLEIGEIAVWLYKEP